MSDSRFSQLPDWKSFERFCADLLEAEGFYIESEPFVDRHGVDILASEEHRSHSGDPIRLRWRVQCKHYAGSRRNFRRREMEENLASYEARRKPNEGLLIIIDTDYTEEAKSVVSDFLQNRQDARVSLWNQRQLLSRLERHPHIALRYGLYESKFEYNTILAPLRRFCPAKILLISDQSVLAHNLVSALRGTGFEIVFLPFWNYRTLSLAHSAGQADAEDFDLAVIFLGDSFGFPIPDSALRLVLERHDSGTPLLLFPFLAWAVSRGRNRVFDEVLPVQLLDPMEAAAFGTRQIVGEFRHGDFRWLLESDAFAEDEYRELDPSAGQRPFTDDISSPFGLSHTFEYLEVKADSTCVWTDTSGNPMVVIREQDHKRVCYLNTCCHSCMTTIPIISPLEASPSFALLLRNILGWLLSSRKATHPSRGSSSRRKS